MKNPKGTTNHIGLDRDSWLRIVDTLKLKPAVLYQCLGPNWKHIHYLCLPDGRKKPFYSTLK